MSDGPNLSGVGARLDTLLAVSFRNANVTRIVTNHAKEYEVFTAFEIVYTFRGRATNIS